MITFKLKAQRNRSIKYFIAVQIFDFVKNLMNELQV